LFLSTPSPHHPENLFERKVQAALLPLQSELPHWFATRFQVGAGLPAEVTGLPVWVLALAC